MKRESKGFIRSIILIIIVLVILGYFGFNIKDIFESDTVKDNLAYFWEHVKNLWNNYLIVPAMWIYENIIQPMWKILLYAINMFKDFADSL